MLALRGRRFLLFAVRFLTGLSPLTCLGATSDLERIFASKISLWAVAVTKIGKIIYFFHPENKVIHSFLDNNNIRIEY